MNDLASISTTACCWIMLPGTDTHTSNTKMLRRSSAYARVKLDNCPNFRLFGLFFFFLLPTKTQSKCFLCGGQFSERKLWHADSHPPVGGSILFTQPCLTNLSGVPSVGQR